MMAVLSVLKWCNRIQKQSCKVTFFTDSQVIVDCFTKHDFSDLASKSRANHDLWYELISETLKGHHEIQFKKVKGHNGNERNEEVDRRAKAQALKARHERYGY